MVTRMIFTTLLILMAGLGVAAQGTFTPRDADEAEGWQIYNQYKASRAAETAATNQIKQTLGDVATASMSSLGLLGADPSDRAMLAALRQKVDSERQKQTQLLARWGEKFYWRYGDLAWAVDKIKDPKTKREMDRIEFALTYFPFDPKKAASPSGGGSTGATWRPDGPWNGMQIKYSISGVNVTSTEEGGPFCCWIRTLGGGIPSSGTIRVTGSVGMVSGLSAAAVVSVTAGSATKEWRTEVTPTKKPWDNFDVSVEIPKGATGASISISMVGTYGSAAAGESRGISVVGNFSRKDGVASAQAGPPAGPTPAPAVKTPSAAGVPATANRSKAADELIKQGAAFFTGKQYDKALTAYDQALAIDPNDADALRQRGMAKRELKDLPGALRDFDNSIRLDPNNSRAYVGRGITRERMSNPTGALADYDYAIVLDPAYVNAYFYHGLLKLGQNDHKAAISDFDRVIELDPTNGGAYNNRGLARARGGDTAGAVADYEKAISINPNDEAAKKNLAGIRPAPPASGSEKIVFSSGNDYGVANGGKPPVFTLAVPTVVTQINSYHWNNGRGAPGGTVWLMNTNGDTFGPWQVTVRANVYWEVNQRIKLPAGTYTFFDSDPSTWAQNSQSGGRGMVIIKGEQ